MTGRAVRPCSILLAVLPLLLSGCTWIARASVNTEGGDADAGSFVPSLSGYGRYVAFASNASDLVAGDGNGTTDIFVRDVRTGTTTRVSTNVTGGDANGHSDDAAISADGRYVAFTSVANNLVAAGDNCCTDVFVRDLQVGTTIRLGTTTGTDNEFSHSFNPTLSANGRYVAFESWASDLVPGDGNGVVDVFVYDQQLGVMKRVSVDPGGGDANGFSEDPSISADGRYVSFDSDANNLVSGDNNGTKDVFVRDLLRGTTTRVSVDMHGGDPNGTSGIPSLSANGRFVAFQSDASNLVVGDGTSDPFCWDLFVRDLRTMITTRVSVAAAGGDPECDSTNAAISGDGRYVAFVSLAGDLVGGDDNGVGDIFVRDRKLDSTTRVSVGADSREAPAESRYPSIAADGRYVAFDSTASTFDPEDANGTYDVFVHAVSSPKVEFVKPSEVRRGSTKKLSLTGTGFGPGTSLSTSLAIPDGVTINSVTVISDTRLSVAITVDTHAPTGLRNLYLQVRGPGPGVLGLPGSIGVCVGCLLIT
jgi:Tol biopolymer transport system component